MTNVNLRRRKLVRRAAILGAVVLLAGTSVSVDSMAGSPPLGGRWSQLPARITRELHFTNAELPPFPVRPDSLRDIARWPAVWTVEGRSYPLRISILGWDTKWDVSDRSKIEPDHGYGASYRIDMKEPGFVRSAGPSYYWLPDSTLVEQAYRTRNSTEVRTYDAKGTLDLYKRYGRQGKNWFSCAKVEPVALEEWFDQDGTLVGFRAMGRCYWDGKERTEDEYSRLFIELRGKRPLWRRKPAA